MPLEETIIPLPYRLSEYHSLCQSHGHGSTTLPQKFDYMPPDISGSVQLVEHLLEEVADSRSDTALQVLVFAAKNSEVFYGLLFNFEMVPLCQVITGKKCN